MVITDTKYLENGVKLEYFGIIIECESFQARIKFPREVSTLSANLMDI